MSEILQGLVIPEDSNSIAVSPEVVAPFHVSDRADLAVAAFGALGLVADKTQLTETVTVHMQNLHNGLSGTYGAEDVEPFMAIELTDAFPLRALLGAFDTQQSVDSYVYETLWNQYTRAELNSRQVGKDTATQSANGIAAEPRVMLLATEYEAEAGLRHINKNLKDQIKAVGGLALVNPADYIILNAQRREAGQPLLDRNTFTRFVQLEQKRAGGDSCVPNADSNSGQLFLSRSFEHANSVVGVRLSVGQNL